MKGDWRWVGETRHGDYVVGWKRERLIERNFPTMRYSTDRAVRVRHRVAGLGMAATCIAMYLRKKFWKWLARFLT